MTPIETPALLSRSTMQVLYRLSRQVSRSQVTLIFDKRVILARKLFFNYGGNDAPISLGKTRPNHRVSDPAACEHRLHLPHNRTQGDVVHQHPRPAPMKLCVTVDDGDLAVTTLDGDSGQRSKLRS